MATKPKAILSTMDNREASPITKASNVLFENGQTAQDILNDRQDAMISPVIENSSSMFKVGQGDDVDYSSNVVNGAYESMVLKGKSMVNCIQEPSSEDVVLPYEFEEGRYVTINDTKESGALGVELKGQTLVNTITNVECQYSWATVDNETFTHIKDSAGFSFINYNCSLKPNTKYFIRFEYDYVSNENLRLQFGFRTNLGAWDTYGTTLTKGVNKTTLTTNGTSNNLSVIIMSGQTLESASFGKLMIIEYQEGMENWDIPYFEGMTSCKMPILHTVGKNLFNIKTMSNRDGWHCDKTVMDDGRVKLVVNNTNGVAYWQTDEFPVEVGKTYSISTPAEGSISHCLIWTNDNKTKAYTSPITITPDIKTISIGVYMNNSTMGNTGYCKIQIEEGSARTSYEAHKSSILSLPEEVVLRSLPNGVCDTFNTRTGVYTQRIGEVVLNGENYTGFSKDSALENDTTCKYFISNFFSKYLNGKGGQNEKVVLNCNYLPPVSFNHMQDKTLSTYPCIANSGAGSLNLRVGKDIDSISLLLAYLQSNPITIQYELATPIITKINLPSTLKSWNTTTHIYSEIPENTLYPTLTHSNPTYPVILKPSTKYSIVANSYSNNHTNSTINFNLGGATASTTVGSRVTTITTPSTLSNELLTMSGRGNKLNNVMVIEGDVVGDEPYFEGICDCKSPILSNVGKNLFDRVGCSPNFTHCASWWWEDNVLKIKSNGQTYNSVGFDFYLKKGTYSISVNEPTYIKVSVIDSHTIFETTTTGRTFTVSNDSKIRTTFFANLNTTGVVEKAISNIQLEESTTPTTYESYKSNILSCTNGIVKLTEDMFEQGTTAQYTANIGKTYQWMKENSTPSYDARRLRTKSLIKIEPNTKLILQNTDNFMYAMSGYGVDKLSLGTFDTSWVQNTTITIPQDVYYIGFSIRKKDDTSITIGDFKNTKFTLSEVDKTIVLRSLPNGVCDTLNVETGEYVQRIGEVVFNGSDEEVWYKYSNNTNEYNTTDKTSVFNISVNGKKLGYNTSICDTFKNTGSNKAFDMKYVEPFTYSDHPTLDNCYFDYGSNNNYTLNDFKVYLQQNPITVQYELATPIIATIDVQGFPHAYKDGHIQLTSASTETSLTPTVEYSVATNRNGQIRSNQKMVERHQKQLDQLQAIILANLVNSQYNQTLTTLKYELSRV